ncbi:MAG: 16S rRNA (uracil(1498)-N(3))-methyltransferase [bacterium]|nr:16S rRNA (uracil(1498)-N(3))-methyltransferase [bacterium]
MNIFIAHINGLKAELTPEESWHCAKVLRKKAGDAVHLIDGNGNFYDGVLDLVTERLCSVSITRGPVEQTPSSYYLHLAIAPTKQIDRVEWMLEKAVEIGLHEVSFFSSHNSERKVVKMERLHKIIESAVKQSIQARIPKLNELIEFKEIIKNQTSPQKLIAHCFDDPKKDIRAVNFRNKSTLVLIGPEGDFTETEVKLAKAQNFEAISLGHNRLRSETAGLYVCQAASLLG